MNAEDGMFTDRGYIVYKGYYSMLMFILLLVIRFALTVRTLRRT